MFRFAAKVIFSFLSALLALAGPAAAQAPVGLSAAAAPTPAPSFRNAVRFDVGGVLASNLANTLLGNGGLLLPLLASYERQLGQRFGLVGEALLNGGPAWERKAGVAVQGRYYLFPTRDRTALSGCYLAPVLSYRAVAMGGVYESRVHRPIGGVGVLAGWQHALGHSPNLFIDLSFGVMSWKKIGPDKVDGPAQPDYSRQTYYEFHGTDADGRLGIGFRF